MYKEDTKRDRWGSRSAFILAMVGSCIGYGNFLRFPYLVYTWGGSLFFIPYLVNLISVGVPLLLLEMALGEKFQRGDIGLSRGIHPRLAGIGYATIMTNFLYNTYYNIIICWSLLYFVMSFMSPLPWSVQKSTDGNSKVCPNLYISEE